MSNFREGGHSGEMTINHRKQKLRRHVLPRPVGSLLIGEGNETGKYIFGLCFPMVPADTGRPPREQGGGGGADELGRQAEGRLRNRPAGCFAESERR